MKLSRLNPRQHGSDSTNSSIPLTMHAFFLPQPNRSWVQAVISSNTARTVESAAKDMNTKNRLPHILPPGRLLKIFGSVMNIRLGPLFTSTLYAKHAGKMISPEESATSVSSKATFTDSPSRVLSLPM